MSIQQAFKFNVNIFHSNILLLQSCKFCQDLTPPPYVFPTFREFRFLVTSFWCLGTSFFPPSFLLRFSFFSPSFLLLSSFFTPILTFFRPSFLIFFHFPFLVFLFPFPVFLLSFSSLPSFLFQSSFFPFPVFHISFFSLSYVSNFNWCTR